MSIDGSRIASVHSHEALSLSRFGDGASSPRFTSRRFLMSSITLDGHVSTRWDQLQLHAWLTVAVMHGGPRPEKSRMPGPANDAARMAQVRHLLGLAYTGSLEVVDCIGNRLTLDDGIVIKMASASYRGRVPYLRSVVSAPSRAVEVWRQLTRSQATGAVAPRDYYLVPIRGDREHDGYAVIAERGRIFNFLFFRASYADTTLRSGVLLHKAYADGVLCSSGCSKALADERRELGRLRDENRRLVLELRDERKARKAYELELSRLEVGPLHGPPPKASS
jgi:hypothetical protein